MVTKDPEAILSVQLPGDAGDVVPCAGSELQMDSRAPPEAMQIGAPSDAEDPV